ncbi:glycosyltransferase family 2 protein [Negadavirga shengliensis]|uniref:Glycosyltransferase family 2 protein n=1 Tax=Negadavirga shengliensis TaxID=1389218 RepID=A0ABV9T3P0_9BACT
MEKAAIVILNFNGRNMLQRFLPNILANSTFEIVVIDNASRDGSVNFLNENYPGMAIVQLENNFGYSQGYNLGLQRLKGKYEYYILLNSDVEATPEWDSRMVSFMDKMPKAAAAQPKMLSLIHKNEFDYAGAAGGYLDPLGYPYCRGRILHTIEKDYGQYDDPAEVDWASGACLVVRAGVFHLLNGFNPEFFAHMEEIELCLRMRNRGYGIYVNPCVKVYHLGGGTLSQSSPFKTYLNFRNSLFMLYLNLRKSRFMAVLALRLLFDFAAMIHISYSKGTGHGKAIIKAYLDFIKRAKSMNNKDIKSNCQLSTRPENNFSVIINYYLRGKKSFRDLS